MVSEILQSLLPYLGFGVFAIPVLVYGAVKYAHGPTPEVRREGLDLMLDVLVGAVMFGVFTALINSNFFTQAVQIGCLVNNREQSNTGWRNARCR